MTTTKIINTDKEDLKYGNVFRKIVQNKNLLKEFVNEVVTCDYSFNENNVIDWYSAKLSAELKQLGLDVHKVSKETSDDMISRMLEIRRQLSRIEGS